MTTSTTLRERTPRHRDPWPVVPDPELRPDSEGSLLQGWLQDEMAQLLADEDGMAGGRPPLPVDELVEALRAIDEAAHERGGPR